MRDIMAARTVLIVDDHQAFAESLAISLESRPGFAVVGVAGFAEAAVDAAMRDLPDEILLDIRLGLDDGLAVARRIRELLPDVLIIVISACDDWAWIARAASAGANGYVAKSGSLNELVDVLRAARLGAFLIAPPCGGVPGVNPPRATRFGCYSPAARPRCWHCWTRVSGRSRSRA